MPRVAVVVDVGADGANEAEKEDEEGMKVLRSRKMAEGLAFVSLRDSQLLRQLFTDSTSTRLRYAPSNELPALPSATERAKVSSGGLTSSTCRNSRRV